MKTKNFSIIVFTLVFFVGVLSVYPAQKQTDKAVEGKTIPNLGGKVVIEPSADCYVSDLILDNNSTNHKKSFEHNLGVVPKTVTVYFTSGHGDYYPLMQRWKDATYNPVTIEVTGTHIILNIYSSGSLFGAWNADNGQWTYWKEGYWLVAACK